MAALTEAWTVAACLKTLAVFLVLAAPVYLILRLFVRTVRQAYGFDPPADDGPPLCVCFACGNTVMESDLSDCPYCGVPLPGRDTASAGTEEPRPSAE